MQETRTRVNQKLSKPVTTCLTLEAATHKHAKRLAKEAGRRMHLPRLSLASFVAMLIEREWNAPKA
jgi:hypothetical protein